MTRLDSIAAGSLPDIWRDQLVGALNFCDRCPARQAQGRHPISLLFFRSRLRGDVFRNLRITCQFFYPKSMLSHRQHFFRRCNRPKEEL